MWKENAIVAIQNGKKKSISKKRICLRKNRQLNIREAKLLIYKYCKQYPFSALVWRHVLAWLETLPAASLCMAIPRHGCIKYLATTPLRHALPNKVVASSHHFLCPFLSWNGDFVTFTFDSPNKEKFGQTDFNHYYMV